MSGDQSAHAKNRRGQQWEVPFATAVHYPGENYDFVTFFDCLHDMGDPVGASAHVRSTLKSDGTWMIVEPFVEDKIEENLNPVGRALYGASTLICTPASLSQEVSLALGAQAGEKRLRDVVTAGGLKHFRRATQTPFNVVLSLRCGHKTNQTEQATMIVIDNERVQLSTPYGPMQTHIVRPAAPGKYPGIVFYTEIFQVTGADSQDGGDARGAWIHRRGPRDLSRV